MYLCLYANSFKSSYFSAVNRLTSIRTPLHQHQVTTVTALRLYKSSQHSTGSINCFTYKNITPSFRLAPLRDILGFGPTEIALTLVAALVLFGPETLKSMSKEVGKAAAELKELPKTFKEGMDAGAAEAADVTKLKAIAAEKRKISARKKKVTVTKETPTENDDEDEED